MSISTSSLSLLLGFLWLGASGCRSQTEPRDADPPTASAMPEPKASPPPLPEPPVDLVRLPESAYRALLGFAGDNLVLVGDTGIHFVEPGEPPKFHACPTGAHRSLLGEDVVYYEEGHFFVQPARGGERKELFAEPSEPKMTASSPDAFLWVTRSDAKERLTLRQNGNSRLAYETSHSLLALAVDAERAYFVEGTTDGKWRLGTLDLNGERPLFTQFEGTRSPSSLAAYGRAYYYGGPERGVRRLTASFDATEPVTEDLICSPLATHGERVFCAHVGGLSQVGPTGTTRRLPVDARGPVTTVVANERHLAWLEDGGQSGLVARVVDLPD